MQDFTFDKGKIAIALAGVFCLFAVYGAITQFKLPRDAQAVEPAQAIVELEPVNIQLLTQTHLFGQPPQVAVKTNNDELENQRRLEAENRRKQQQQVNTRPIDISVTVTGLLASNDVEFSAAVLKVDNKPEKLYRVGEDLGKPEVILQDVDRDSVVLDNNGYEQIIVINRPGLESGSGASMGAGNNNFPSFDQNASEIPELPPELELPEQLENLNDAAFGGAYTPPPSEPTQLDTSEVSSLTNDLQDQLLLDELETPGLDQQTRSELEAELDDHDSMEDFEDETDANSPDFQMPVF